MVEVSGRAQPKKWGLGKIFVNIVLNFVARLFWIVHMNLLTYSTETLWCVKNLNTQIVHFTFKCSWKAVMKNKY
jgi:hypothetical protein